MGTLIARTELIARSDMIHSGLFSESIATVSPGLIPNETRPKARRFTFSSNSPLLITIALPEALAERAGESFIVFGIEKSPWDCQALVHSIFAGGSVSAFLFYKSFFFSPFFKGGSGDSSGLFKSLCLPFVKGENP